jgi:predicted nucleic acid-binding protein
VKVVVDASPLIALARIERLELLQKMFGGVVVPSAVWREVVAAGSDKTGASQVAGEAEAIVLAHELPADLLIMDEHLGRVTARDFGVHTVGLVGVLVEARKRGLLPDAGSIAEALHRKAGFWLSADLRRLIAG